MAEYVLIYSSAADPRWYKARGPESIGPARVLELDVPGVVRGIGVANIAELKAELVKLRNDGILIDRMQFVTHGNAGGIYFGNDRFDAHVMASQFVGQGFEDLFVPGAHVFCHGCNVADHDFGCSYGELVKPGGFEACSNLVHGPDLGRTFLLKFAQVFLYKAGGRVGASTSVGLPINPFNHKVYHFWGDTVYAYISRGGQRLRIAVGDEMSTPGGMWLVATEHHNYLYFFDDDSVRWEDDDTDAEGHGTWRWEGDWMRMDWGAGLEEYWDRPLFSDEQWGFWKTPSGNSVGLTAKHVPYTR
jgi:hypothetical protein